MRARHATEPVDRAAKVLSLAWQYVVSGRRMNLSITVTEEGEIHLKTGTSKIVLTSDERTKLVSLLEVYGLSNGWGPA